MPTSNNGFIKQHNAFTPPYVQQGEGIAPPLGNDLQVCPFLPKIRQGQYSQGNFTNFDLPVVIEAGEPVGIWNDTARGKFWLVPASPTAYNLSYGADDVGKCEDIDSAGSAVGSAGSSSASIPAVLPIGVMNAPAPRNARLSDGTLEYENFEWKLKETVMRRRLMQYPYYRFGSNGIGHVEHGDLMGIRAINGNLLSATARAGLAPVRIQHEAGTPATATVVVLTPTHGSLVADQVITITTQGVTVSLHQKADTTGFTSTGTYKYVALGANAGAWLDNVKAALDASALATRLTVTEDGTDLTLTHKEQGAIAVTDNAASITGLAEASNTTGTAGSGAIHAGVDVNPQNMGIIVGRCIRVWASLPDNWDLSKVVTPKDSGLAGTGTGGVAQEVYFAGNTFEGNIVPSSYSQAGAMLVAYEL